MHVQRREKSVDQPIRLPLIPFYMQLLRYCVGLDISKNSLQVCLSVCTRQTRWLALN